MAQTWLSDDDLSEFLSTEAFGSEATFKSKTINTVFTNNYISITGGTVDIEGTYPVALCRLSDVTGVAHNDVLTIDSKNYVVIGIQPNNSIGTVKLVLNEP
jgi:hypothetical protein